MATAYCFQGYGKTRSVCEPNGFDITVNFSSLLTSTVKNAGGDTLAVGSSAVVDVATENIGVQSSALALAINDTIALCKLPKGAVILDYLLFIPDLESSTGALTLDLGLASTNSSTAGIQGATAATSNAACFIAASTIGRAGGLVTPTLSLSVTLTTPAAPGAVVPTGLYGGVPLQPLIADDVLQLTAHAAATAAGSGGPLLGWVRYHMRSNVWTNS